MGTDDLINYQERVINTVVDTLSPLYDTSIYSFKGDSALLKIDDWIYAVDLPTELGETGICICPAVYKSLVDEYDSYTNNEDYEYVDYTDKEELLYCFIRKQEKNEANLEVVLNILDFLEEQMSSVTIAAALSIYQP